MKHMYESPKLNRVGDARDVVLGIIPTGDDIDGTWIGGNFEFAQEADIEEE
jgi:hypothetical protein